MPLPTPSTADEPLDLVEKKDGAMTRVALTGDTVPVKNANGTTTQSKLHVVEYGTRMENLSIAIQNTDVALFKRIAIAALSNEFVRYHEEKIKPPAIKAASRAVKAFFSKDAAQTDDRLIERLACMLLTLQGKEKALASIQEEQERTKINDSNPDSDIRSPSNDEKRKLLSKIDVAMREYSLDDRRVTGLENAEDIHAIETQLTFLQTNLNKYKAGSGILHHVLSELLTTAQILINKMHKEAGATASIEIPSGSSTNSIETTSSHSSTEVSSFLGKIDACYDILEAKIDGLFKERTSEELNGNDPIRIDNLRNLSAALFDIQQKFTEAHRSIANDTSETLEEAEWKTAFQASFNIALSKFTPNEIVHEKYANIKTLQSVLAEVKKEVASILKFDETDILELPKNSDPITRPHSPFH